MSMAGHPRVLRMSVSVLSPQPFVGQLPQSPPTPQQFPINRLKAEHVCHHQFHVQPQDAPKPRAVLNATLSWTSHLFSPKPHQSPHKLPSIPFHRPPPAVTPQLTKHIRLPWTHETPVSSSSTAVFVCPSPTLSSSQCWVIFQEWPLAPTATPAPPLIKGRRPDGQRDAVQPR